MLPNYPITTQNKLGRRLFTGVKVDFNQLPKKDYWVAKVAPLQATKYAATQLPSYPPLRGAFALVSSPPRGRLHLFVKNNLPHDFAPAMTLTTADNLLFTGNIL